MTKEPPETISYRLAHASDASRVALIGQATFLEAFAGFIDGDDLVAHCLEQHAARMYEDWLRDDLTRVWIAEVAGAPIGYIVLTRPELNLPDLAPTDWEVKRVYVLSRFQGRGCGARLMELARSHAWASGGRRLLLGVNQGNGAAIRFYEKLGYSKVGTRKFPVGKAWHDDYILGLPLIEESAGVNGKAAP